MSETQLIAISGAVLAAMFGLLTAILGWIGSKMYAKMEEISKTMRDIAGDLHERINGIDRRVTVVETVQRSCHREGGT